MSSTATNAPLGSKSYKTRSKSHISLLSSAISGRKAFTAPTIPLRPLKYTLLVRLSFPSVVLYLHSSTKSTRHLLLVPHPSRARQGRHPRPGPLPRRRPSARSLLLRPQRRPNTTLAQKRTSLFLILSSCIPQLSRSLPYPIPKLPGLFLY